MVLPELPSAPGADGADGSDGAAEQVAVAGAQIRCLPAFGVVRL